MYRSLLRRKRERLAAVLGRRELGDDPLARRVRNKVVVGDEESGGIQAAFESLQVDSQNAWFRKRKKSDLLHVCRLGEPEVLDCGETWGTKQARDVV